MNLYVYGSERYTYLDEFKSTMVRGVHKNLIYKKSESCIILSSHNINEYRDNFVEYITELTENNIKEELYYIIIKDIQVLKEEIILFLKRILESSDSSYRFLFFSPKYSTRSKRIIDQCHRIYLKGYSKNHDFRLLYDTLKIKGSENEIQEIIQNFIKKDIEISLINGKISEYVCADEIPDTHKFKIIKILAEYEHRNVLGYRELIHMISCYMEIYYFIHKEIYYLFQDK